MGIQQSYTNTSVRNVTMCGGFTELAELNYLCIYTLYYFWLNTNMYRVVYLSHLKL